MISKQSDITGVASMINTELCAVALASWQFMVIFMNTLVLECWQGAKK
jgi:hypothetical protein